MFGVYRERERVRRSALTLSVSRQIDLTEQRNISLVSSFLSYREPCHTQYGVVNRVMHHDRYKDRAAVLPADPVPDGSSIVELLDKAYLEEVPLFNRRLRFFQIRQRTDEEGDGGAVHRAVGGAGTGG